MSMTDEELCRLAQSGDDAARDTLVARYFDLVGKRARGYLSVSDPVPVEWEDLGQEGFLGLLSAIEGYDPAYGAAFRTFATLAVDRRMTDAVRAALRKKQVPAAAKVELVDLPDAEDPERTVLLREELARVRIRLERKISARERDTLALHLAGFSNGEIAARLDCDVKSVENSLGRVRRKLNSV
ncbi:MAG: sigma-70 family RNA polymerase sigma factor [Clostridia bacterium]|nr:sigma-70 family RNA polymerase sigma factor [Clostridia bacterium]